MRSHSFDCEEDPAAGRDERFLPNCKHKKYLENQYYWFVSCCFLWVGGGGGGPRFEIHYSAELKECPYQKPQCPTEEQKLEADRMGWEVEACWCTGEYPVRQTTQLSSKLAF